MTPLIAAAFAAVPRSEWSGGGEPAPPTDNPRRWLIPPLVDTPEAPTAAPPPETVDGRGARIHALRLQGVPWSQVAALVGYADRASASTAYRAWLARCGEARATPASRPGPRPAAARARVVEAVLRAGGPPGAAAGGFWRDIARDVGEGMTPDAARLAWRRARLSGEVSCAAAD